MDPGSVKQAVADGLALRYDGGPCFRSAQFNQTLKEQVLWIERFDTLDELRAPIRQFAEDFNEHWLLERHGYRTPRQTAHAMHQAATA